MPRDYTKLKVFKFADDLVFKIYRATERFPSHELYGITSQLRRAAVSVPTNIAEGSGRSTDRDFANFLSIAYGSLAEVRYLCSLSHRLGYLNEATHTELHGLCEETSRMLNSLLARVRSG